MTIRRPPFARPLLVVLPLSVLLACAAESGPEPTTTSDEALRPDPVERKGCSNANPSAHAAPTQGWDVKDLLILKENGCGTPLVYWTGASAGVLGGTMLVCADHASTHFFIAKRTDNPNAWAPVGFCDAALEKLPSGQRYVALTWFMGPNCSGCSVGAAPW